MKDVLLGGVLGLAMGIGIQRLGLARRVQVSRALALRDLPLLRRLLLFLGVGTVLTALLMWLAVIDVDTVAVPALDAGVLLGGLLFGAALGYVGFAPATAPAVLGAERLLEGLCAVLGVLAGGACLPYAEGVFQPIRSLWQTAGRTWFRVTLDEPWLFAGGFLGQGCLGLVLIAAALCIRRPQLPAPVQEEPVVEAVSAEPEDVQEKAIVMALPGEEPVVVDSAEEPVQGNGEEEGSE